MEINSLAHEIINPLNIIIGYAELSKLEKIPESVNNNINEIIKQSLWCYQLLDNQLNHNKNVNINLEYFITELINEIKLINDNNEIILKIIKKKR